MRAQQQASAVRSVIQATQGMSTSDGAGVKLTRMMGFQALDMLDPFLLFDVFRSDDAQDYIAGFPPHPHRGFETVTYLLNGRVRHQDSEGHNGVIEAGDVQWMTAARGIVHSEMPEQEDGLLEGFQLWVNLPGALKMSEPRYQEFSHTTIPLESRDPSTTLRVIAGRTSAGTVGPVKGIPTEPIYLDVELGVDGAFLEPVPHSHNAFIYVIEGAVSVLGEHSREDQVVEARTLAVLGDGDRVQIAGREPGNRLLLAAGKRLDEPVVRGGPFVMNSHAELLQAYHDFERGVF